MAIVLNDKEKTSITAANATQAANADKEKSNNEISTDGKNICRIVEDTSIPKQIVLDELSADAVESIKSESEDTNYTLKKVGGQAFPIIRISDYILTLDDIKSVTIYNNDRIPSISLTFKTTGGDFISKNMPQDGDIVSIFMSTGTDTIKSLRNDYVIKYVSTNTTSSGSTISINGELNIPGFNIDTTFGVLGTSKDAFKEAAKRFGLGFATDDLEETNDKQIWICTKIPCLDFLNDTILHTWKDEMSFYDWWIDERYNINFINVNKMLLENTKDLDLTANSSGFSSLSGSTDTTSQKNTKATVKMFTNIPEYQKGVFFIKKWNVINNSTDISQEYGVEIRCESFRHNQNIYTHDDISEYITLSNVPSYDTNKTKNHILLRGRAEYSKEKNPNGEQARANYNYNDIYIKRPWSGIEYVMSDCDNELNDNSKWSGNVNKNFYRSFYHNMINLKELDKMNILIECDGLNLQIMRGEVVPLGLKKSSEKEVTQGLDRQTGRTERFYNGWYYVKSIEYNYKAGKTASDGTVTKTSKYTTKILLTRREWTLPVDAVNPDEVK